MNSYPLGTNIFFLWPTGEVRKGIIKGTFDKYYMILTESPTVGKHVRWIKPEEIIPRSEISELLYG